MTSPRRSRSRGSYLPDERIVCSTNCGMAPMPREIAYAKLRSLADGALLASVGL